MPGLQLPTSGRHGRWSTRILDEIDDLRIHWEVTHARAEGKTRDEAIAALARPEQEEATLAAYKRAGKRLREDPHKLRGLGAFLAPDHAVSPRGRKIDDLTTST
jgi:hypothetical protein